MQFLCLLEQTNKRSIVDVGDEEVFLNPTYADMAALLAKHGKLRALSSRGYFVVWGAEKHLHEPIKRALNFDIRARRFTINGRVGIADSNQPLTIGRYAAAIWTDLHQQLKPNEYSPEMRLAFGLK